MKISYPISAVLELTYDCNHSCKFCSCPWEAADSEYERKKELSVNEWRQAINRLVLIGVRNFTISGGEVLMKDGFEKIIKYIHSLRNLSRFNDIGKITVISNGRLMSMQSLAVFKECGVHLALSLPGYETFKWHTNVDNANGVLSWLRKAKEIGLSTTVNVTVTKRNLYELSNIITKAFDAGAGNLLLNRFLPGGRGLECMKELFLSNRELNQMLDIAENTLRQFNARGNTGTEIPLCAIDNPYRYKQLNISYACAAAKEFMVVDPAGQIRVCNHSPRVVGNIINQSFINDMKYWNLFVEKKYRPNECGNCLANKFCDCGCREVASILSGSPCVADCSLALAHKDYYEKKSIEL